MEYRAMRLPRFAGLSLIGGVLVIFLNGCSLLPVHYELPAAGELDCGAELSRLDTDIARYTYFDPALHGIPGEPLLRSNRFVASFASPSLQGEELQHWLQQMNELAVNAYRIEFSRLPIQVQNDWNSRLPDGLDSMLNQCSKAYLSDADKLAPSLIDKVQPKDNYSAAQRFWGIYPVTKRLAASSIEAYRTEMTARIQSGNSRQFHQQTVYLPSPEDTQTNSQISGSSKQNSALATALLQHAPELVVERKSKADEVGSPFWEKAEEIAVNTEKPQAYTYVSHTRYKSEILTQLNYVYWFSGRPKKSRGDLYGGDLDAVVWRVTLNSQGKPVLYDTIHACGCYHLLFLPSGTQIDPDRIHDEKPLVFPLSLPANASARFIPHLRLKIEAETHYLIGVSEVSTPLDAFDNSHDGSHNDIPDEAAKTIKNAVVYYSLQPYETLLSMPVSCCFNLERRSLFGPDGIVAQSSRLERFILWPLGVPNAGAMREAGTHAIAFVGKRHFEGWPRFM